MNDGDQDDQPAPSILRPYVLTGGQTQSGVDLAIESIVTQASTTTNALLTSERHEILDATQTPISIAEIASRLDLPLGVARYLVSDMVAAGLLDKHEESTNTDNALIERLIKGIEAL